MAVIKPIVKVLGRITCTNVFSALSPLPGTQEMLSKGLCDIGSDCGKNPRIFTRSFDAPLHFIDFSSLLI